MILCQCYTFRLFNVIAAHDLHVFETGTSHYLYHMTLFSWRCCLYQTLYHQLGFVAQSNCLISDYQSNITKVYDSKFSTVMYRNGRPLFWKGLNSERSMNMYNVGLVGQTTIASRLQLLGNKYGQFWQYNWEKSWGHFFLNGMRKLYFLVESVLKLK